MVTPKPAFGAKDYFNLGSYFPRKEEVDQLVQQMESVIGTNTTKGFHRTLWQLITILRQKADAHENAPNLDNSLVELEHIQKALTKNIQLFDNETGINENTYNHYFHELIKRNIPTDECSPIAAIYSASQVLLEITKSIKENMEAAKKNTPKNPYTPTKMRQIAAEELARALEIELGIKPTKTRGGVFDQCYQLLVKTVGYTNLSDSFPVIKAAIDEYPKKPKLGLLEVESFPGLWGHLPT